MFLTTANGSTPQSWQFANNASGASGEFSIRDSTGTITALTILKETAATGINATSPGAQLQITAFSSSTIGQIIKLAASQSADAFEVQDSSANVLTRISSGGQISFGSSATSGGLGGSTRYIGFAGSANHLYFNIPVN